MPRSQLYICPTCKATNRINAHPKQSIESFMKELPEDMPCGRRGCNDRVVKRERLDNLCTIEVGIHHGPYFKDKERGVIVCVRHKAQYNWAHEHGEFDWEEI